MRCFVFFKVYDRLLGDNKKVAAILLLTIYWRTNFDGLLPPGADGITIILANTCGQQMTYRVDGTMSSFVGYGDLHESKYDDKKFQVDVKSIFEAFAINSNAVAATKDQDKQYIGCRYSISVYPSTEFEESHYTMGPTVQAITLAALFVVTSFVFLFYDYMVERRQRVVMKSAQQTGKIVHSLFPEEVRSRMYQEQEEKAKEKHPGWENNNKHGLDDAKGSEAMANLYPDATVFFADIVGFTQWSSTRTPAEVFQLLEALYGAFDKLALRRKVFKVETIGDCYLAGMYNRCNGRFLCLLS